MNLENFARNIYKRITSIQRATFIAACIFGLLTHIFYLTNITINEDFYIPRISTWVSQYSFGRWLPGIAYFFLPYPMPAVVGALTIIALAITATLCVSLFDIRSKQNAFCVALLIVTFPATAYISGYSGLLLSYTMALMLAVLAAWLVCKINKRGWLWGGLALGASLAIYQAYIAVTMILLLCILIFCILEKSTDGSFWKDFFYKISSFIAVGIIGVVFYVVGLQLSCQITGFVIKSNYTGITDVGISGIQELFIRIQNAFKTFYTFFFRDGIYDFSQSTEWAIGLLLLLFVIGVCVTLFKRRLSWLQNALVLAMIGLIPLCVCIMEIVAPKIGTTSVSCFSFVFVLVAILSFIEQSSCCATEKQLHSGRQKLMSYAVGLAAVAVLLFSFQQYLLSNVYYLKLATYYERTYAMANRVLSRIEEIPEFHKRLPVAFVGELPSDSYPSSPYNFPEITSDRGLWGQYVGMNRAPQSTYKTVSFINFFLGVPMVTATPQQVEMIETTTQFHEMNAWPDKDSVAVINEVIVVKLNNTYKVKAENIGGRKYLLSVLSGAEDQYSYAWYIDAPNGTREFIQWYQPTDELSYEFLSSGVYSITLFVQNQRGESVTIEYDTIEVP